MHSFLVALKRPDQTDSEFQESFEELHELAWTYGTDVIGSTHQKRAQIHVATYIGPGKINEIQQTLANYPDALVIFDGSLSPKQNQNLEKRLKREVWDRTKLILEIFQQHAKTREARAQVELAHLQYMLPRLTRMWKHLDRERGGIGASRGTGEKQIESDRRLIGKRISHLKEELATLQTKRQTQKRRRNQDCLKVCLVGYTNAGKSTVMSRITHTESQEEDKLFATLDSTTRAFHQKHTPPIVISDTVGFIRNLPHELVASFHSTLEVAQDADLLLQVIDVTSDYEAHIQTTEQVLEEIHAHLVPRILVFNKVDALENEAMVWILQKQYPDAIFISAHQADQSRLEQAIVQFFEKRMDTLQFRLNYQSSAHLGQIYKSSRVDQIEYQDDGIYLTLTASPQQLQHLQSSLELAPL